MSFWQQRHDWYESRARVSDSKGVGLSKVGLSYTVDGENWLSVPMTLVWVGGSTAGVYTTTVDGLPVGTVPTNCGGGGQSG